MDHSLYHTTSLKVLLIEDSPLDRLIYRRYLQQTGCVDSLIMEAPTLDKGLEMWYREKPDLVLLDLNLPDGNGLKFLEEIGNKNKGEKLPVIILTGEGNEKIAVEAMKLGAFDYIVKDQELVNLLNNSFRQVQKLIELNKQVTFYQQQEFLLEKILLQIYNSFDLKDITFTIVSEVRQFFVCDRVLLYKFNDDFSGQVIAESVIEPWTPCLDQLIMDSCFQKSQGGGYQEDRVSIIEDIEQANLTECHRQLLRRFQVKANLVIPVILPKNDAQPLWGLLIAHQCSTTRQWLDREINLMQQLGKKLAIALQQVENYQKIEAELRKREETEAKLRESEERYANLTEAAPVGIFYTDIKGNCLYVNERYCQILNIDSEMALGKNWEKLIYAEDRDFVIQSWYESVVKQEPLKIEYRYQCPDGNIVWTYAQSIPNFNAQGEIIGYIGTITDITEKKEAEIALKNSEFLHKQAQKIAHIGHWEYNLIENTLYWSEEVYRIFELNPQEFSPSYDNFLKIIHPEDRDQVHQCYREHLKSQTTYDLNHRLLMADGRIKYVQEHCETLFNDQGKPLRSLGTVQDITEKMEAENTLKSIIKGTSTAKTGPEFFNTLVEYIAKTINVSYVLISKIVGENLHSLAYWNQGHLENSIYNYPHTPCEIVFQQGYYFCPDNVQFLFPEDIELQKLQAESYLGLLLEDENNIPLGHICVIDTKPLNSITEQKIKQILQVFAARAASELQRLQADEKLQQLNRQLEATVKQRTAQLQGFLDSANDIILSIRLENGTLEYLNRSGQEILGYSLSEIQQLNIFDLMKSECQVKYTQIIPQFQDKVTKDFHKQEFVFLSKNGQEIIVEGNLNIKTENNRPVSLRGIFRDITQRKHTEMALKESKRFIERITDTSPNILYVYNAQQQKNIYVNPVINQILGYSASEIQALGPNFLPQLMHPDDFQRLINIFPQLNALNDHEYLEFEYRMQNSQGEWRWFIDRMAVFSRDPAGNVLEYIGSAADITERKLTEQKLIESQQFIETVIDTIPFPVFWKDRNSVFLGCNQQLISFLNYSSSEDFIGKTDYDLDFKESQADSFIQDDREVMTSGKPKLNIPEYMTLPSGRLRIIETNKAPLRNSQGDIIGLVGMFQDITEKKIIEQEIIFLKDRFEYLLHSTPAIIYSCRAYPHFDATFITPNVQSILGYTPEDFLTNHGFWSDRIHPDDQNRVFEDLSELFTTGHHKQEYRFRHRNGHYIWVRDECTLIRDENGQPTEIVGYFGDVSDRKQIEQKLQESNRKYQRLVEDIGENFVIYSHHLDGTLTYVSGGVNSIFGLEKNLAIGKKWQDIINCQPDDILNIESLQEELIKNTADFQSFEISFNNHQGEKRTIFVLRHLVKDEQDKIIAIEGIMEDITEDKLAKLALQRSNDLLSSISKAQSLFISSENRLTIFEGLLSSLLDLTDSEYGFIGEVLFRDDGSAIMEESLMKIRGVPYVKTHSITNIAWDQTTEEFYQENYQKGMEFGNMKTLFGAVIMTGKPVISNHPTTDPRRGGTPDGHPPLNAFLGIPFYSGSTLVGMVGIANRPQGYDSSIIEYLQPLLTTCANLIEGYRLDRIRKDTENQLHSINEQLLRATRLKDEFLANMSHELRTPLNAILGMSESLQEEIFGPVTPRQLNALQIIERSGNHLLSLINDVLDLSKIEAGQLKLDYSSFSVSQLCQSSLTLVKPLAFKKHLNLQFAPLPTLPDLYADERRLRQVLLNLLNNAIKFTPQNGQVSLEVSTFSQDDEYYLRFAITDTGIGISAENIKKLFKPFSQVDSALNRQYDGTGLGLALVKRLVELHGGDVGVNSIVGQGSCFFVSVPFLSSPSSPDNTPSFITLPPAPSTKSAPLILLAEDNEANIQSIASYLEAKGYSLILAKNGQEAVDLTFSKLPALILMDISMPIMDGFQAISLIRQNPNSATIPIIALTALAMKGDRERCLNAGANDYLAKPVRLKQLVTKIEQLLSIDN